MSNAPYSTSSMFSGANHNTFTNTTFVIQADRNAAFEKLQKAASPSAFHSYVGRPQPGKCYPNTRVKLLKRLEKWAHGMELSEETTDSNLGTESADKTVTELDNDSGDESESGHDTDSESEIPVVLDNLPIIWLRGGAGAGKSAVAQTFAERCEDLGHIVASFFFFNTDPSRNDATRLVATLAYEIARADANARAHMEAVVHQDPRIFDQDFTKQFTSLIVGPIQKSLQISGDEGRHRPCTIIIDGLDECTGSKAQAGIVQAICDSLLVGTPGLYIEMPRFLICSRPEESITHVFRSPALQGMYMSIDLSANRAADRDIMTFLKGKFAEIKQTHRHADRIPEDWPSEHYLWTLQLNSSGHFIYADTVMKFISADVRPVVTLESILGLRASPQRVREPFAELDILYHHILSRALEEIDIETIRIAFGFLGIEKSPAFDYRFTVLEKFLNLQDGDLDILFNITSSLVSVQRSKWRDRIKLCHKSFGDFLHDKHRAGRFYIDDDAVRMHVAARCHTMVTDAATLDEGEKVLPDYKLILIH